MNDDLAIILTAIAIYAAGTISPGPSFTLIVRLAASGARSAALGATVGLSVGAATYATLAMTGFALIITQVGWLMNTIQIAGGCYLIYLGLTAWLSKPAAASSETPMPVVAKGAGRGFRMGLIVELSNPKSIAFFVSIFAVAVPPDAALWVKTTILAGGFFVDFVWYGLAATLLSTRPVQLVYRKFALGIDRALGTVLAAFGIRLISDRL